LIRESTYIYTFLSYPTPLDLSTCPASFIVNMDVVKPSHACKALEICNRSPPKNKLHFAEIHEQSSDLEGYQAIILAAGR
jgi:hypothetical protein